MAGKVWVRKQNRSQAVGVRTPLPGHTRGQASRAASWAVNCPGSCNRSQCERQLATGSCWENRQAAELPSWLLAVTNGRRWLGDLRWHPGPNPGTRCPGYSASPHTPGGPLWARLTPSACHWRGHPDTGVLLPCLCQAVWLRTSPFLSGPDCGSGEVTADSGMLGSPDSREVQGDDDGLLCGASRQGTALPPCLPSPPPPLFHDHSTFLERTS